MLRLKHISFKTANRFWSKVDIKEGNTCWHWKAGFFSDGYGGFAVKRKVQKAHRVAWALANSQDIPDGMVIMHTCDNTKCVNPSHLTLGTISENTFDAYTRGLANKPKKMVCPKGHDTSTKDSRYSSGSCKQCSLLNAKAHRNAQSTKQLATT